VAVLIPVTVTVTAAGARGGASDGDYRRCDRRRASIMDLSLLF